MADTPGPAADFAAARKTLEYAKRQVDSERLTCSEHVHALVAIANGYTRLAEAQKAEA